MVEISSSLRWRLALLAVLMESGRELHQDDVESDPYFWSQG